MATQTFSVLVATLYQSRKDRASHPEGSFDRKQRWYPSGREDCDGDGTCVRSPSAAWPYSYMLRCRTRQHCAALVTAALAGRDVPEDVRRLVPVLSGVPANDQTLVLAEVA